VPGTSLKIFISYRRADTAGYAGWLNYSLVPVFGQEQIFRDVNTLQAGVDFRDEIARTLRQCDVFLCLIGPGWATISDADGRRLDQPDDVLRLEVATALAPPKQVVIPILVQGASMPEPAELPEDIKGITALNAHVMSDGDWDRSIAQLVSRLEVIGAKKEAGSKLTGKEILRRFREDDHPPTWVGRNGGSKGKEFREDVATGRWADKAYEVEFSGGSPSRNWFSVATFAAAVEEGPDAP